MKPYLFINVLFLFFFHSVFAQNIVEQLYEFYANADLECYLDISDKADPWFGLKIGRF